MRSSFSFGTVLRIWLTSLGRPASPEAVARGRVDLEAEVGLLGDLAAAFGRVVETQLDPLGGPIDAVDV